MISQNTRYPYRRDRRISMNRPSLTPNALQKVLGAQRRGPVEQIAFTVGVPRLHRPRSPRRRRPKGRRPVHLRLHHPLRFRGRVSSVPGNLHESYDRGTASTATAGLLKAVMATAGLLQVATAFWRPHSAAVAAAATMVAPAVLPRRRRWEQRCTP